MTLVALLCPQAYEEYLHPPIAEDSNKKDDKYTPTYMNLSETDQKVLDTLKALADKAEDPVQKEIEQIARDWAAREWYRKFVKREPNLPSEKEYVRMVWDEALAEGKKTYDRIHSEDKKLARVADKEVAKKEEQMKNVIFERVKSKFSEKLKKLDLDFDD